MENGQQQQKVDQPPAIPHNPTRSDLASIIPLKKKRRLALDKIGLLEDKIALDRRDTDAWLTLIKEHRRKGKMEDIRKTYDRFLTIYPLAVTQWVDYVNLELEQDNFSQVDTIFSRCLLHLFHVELFKCYLDYVRRRTNLATGGTQARGTILSAFDFAVQRVGLDLNSYPIWRQYIDFIKSGEATTSWEQQQRTDHMRKIYQRAVVVPMHNLEQLWKDYDQFEQTASKANARKYVIQKNAEYMNARQVLNKLTKLTEGLDFCKVAKIPSYDDVEAAQLDSYLKWIEYEKADPLSAGPQYVQVRMQIVYLHALAAFQFTPDMWINKLEYMRSTAAPVDDTDMKDFLERAVSCCPSSFALSFALAEKYELDEEVTKAQSTYESLLQHISEEYKSLQESVQDELAQLEGKKAGIQNQGVDKQEVLQIQTRKLNELNRTLKTVADIESERLGEDASLVWTAFMRAGRRMHDLKEARRIFGLARKFTPISYHIYYASAMLEYHNYDDQPIARNILEYGLKKFPASPAFASLYIDFLEGINDTTSEPNYLTSSFTNLTDARAIFEKVAGQCQQAKLTDRQMTELRVLYARIYQFEAKYGDMTSIQKMRERCEALDKKCIIPNSSIAALNSISILSTASL